MIVIILSLIVVGFILAFAFYCASVCVLYSSACFGWLLLLGFWVGFVGFVVVSLLGDCQQFSCCIFR
jgi:hypothetical protein